MILRGKITEQGKSSKEMPDGISEITHKIKIGEKGEFGLDIKTRDKQIMDDIKKEGVFEFEPGETEVTITVQFKKRKEKFDKEDENLLPNTGDPWYTAKRMLRFEGEEGIDDMLEEIKTILNEPVEIRFV